MTRNSFDYFIIPIFALPAVISGAVAMNSQDVSIQIVLSNLIFLIIGWLVSCYVLYKHSKGRKSENFGRVCVILIALLYALTFVDHGVEDVHRWLTIGPINLYISSIFAPIVIIQIWKQLNKNNELWASAMTLAVAILLVLQPDASQLTAFSISMMIIVYQKINNKIVSFFTIGILSVLVTLSWIFLDSLPVVSYVEEILGLVIDMGLMWSILGITSLIILPIPFIFLPNQKEKTLSWCIGLYFTTVIISTFFGNFPVPVMGYGISPILGYLMAMTWLIKQ